MTYTLGGDDAASFSIVASTGQLQTLAGLDFEGKNSYSVTVSASDRKDATGNADTAIDATIDVTISVTDVDEPRTVIVSPGQPRVGEVLRARVSDRKELRSAQASGPGRSPATGQQIGRMFNLVGLSLAPTKLKPPT